METRKSNKRKSRPEEEKATESVLNDEQIQESRNSENPSILTTYMSRFKKTKLNNFNLKDGKEKINIKTLAQVERGCVDLPKEAVIESIYYKTGIYLIFKYNAGKNDYAYYKCPDANCSYNLKIHERKDLMKTLTTSSLIHNFKRLDISTHTGSDDGISTLTVFGEHKNHSQNFDEISKGFYKKKEGILVCF